MITSNINLGQNVYIEKNSTVNNVIIGDNTKISGNVKIFGSTNNLVEIGEECYFGINTMIEGYNGKVLIGNNVSFAQNICLLTGSGPNASEILQRIFPILKENISVGDHTWIGANSIIMPGVNLGKFCVVAANSFVNQSFDDYSIIGGSPAKLIRNLNINEIEKINRK
jgi:acetyltransferase-like isoleucine patch superfamily enzyme